MTEPMEDDDLALESGSDEAPKRLDLEVDIQTRGACERHIVVKVPRPDVDRYFDKIFSEIMPSAAVPGFRAGRAPRKLIEHRFRKEVVDQVKGSLLLDSMSQITDDHKLAAISEPDIDLTAVEIPDDGPVMFEFNLEVRPEFDIPNWKGLAIERPVREFTDADIDRQMQDLLAQHGRLVPKDGPAEPGDYITTNLSFWHGDEKISSSDEEVLRLRPVLSFRDGRIENFAKTMRGVKAGETREAKAKLTADAPNAALRNQEVTGRFEVLEVKRLEPPELTSSFLRDTFDIDSEEELRDAVRQNLQRRLGYQQQQRARQQVLAALTVAASWELPRELVRRQTQRELGRKVLELRRSGFSDAEIRAHENALRQNSHAATVQALKEHFILERIAEEEKIDATAEDFDDEFRLIAQQTGQSSRRVRAQIEKAEQMDALRNQVVERKTIELILSNATFKDVPFQLDSVDAEAIDQAAGGEDEEETEIPEAKYSDPATRVPTPPTSPTS